MKKLISVLLVLAMLLSVSALFSSCSATSEKDIEKDAQGVISEAFDLVYADFFDTDMGISDVASDAIKGGSMKLSFASQTLLGDAIDKIEVTTYFDQEGDRGVLDALVNYEGEDLTLRAFLDKNRLTVSGEDVFGSQTAYALVFSTLLTDLDNSALLEMMGMGVDDLAELKETFSTLKGSMAAPELSEEDLARLYNDVLAALLPAIGTEDIPVSDDTETCITVAYTVNNTTLKNAAKIFIERTVAESERATALADLDETFANMDTTYNMSLKLYIGKKSGAVSKMTISGNTETSNDWMADLDDGSGEDYTERTTQKIDIVFGATEIVLTGNTTETAWYTEGETTSSVTMKLKKSGTADRTVYDLTCNITEDGEAFDALRASFTYQKQSGDFSLTASVKGYPSDDATDLSMGGKITSSADEAVIAINSLTSGEVTVALQASLTFRAKADIPATPENAKNILTLSEEEINTFFENFSQGKLYEIIEELS